MTYYEELGLGTEASEEEIRRSYQALSRILHPDKQPETVLRKLAAAQMQRLNEVLKHSVMTSVARTMICALHLETVTSFPRRTGIGATLLREPLFWVLFAYFVGDFTAFFQQSQYCCMPSLK